METNYYPEVVQAVPGENGTIFVYFSDGSIHSFDVKPLIGKGVFSRLKDPVFFRENLTVMNGTAAWDISGHFDPTLCIDIDPFTLYESESVADPLKEVS